MDKIETPKEFSLKMLQMSINDVPQREIIKAITARDAEIRADERQKAAERAMEAVGNIPPFRRGEWELMDSRIRAAIISEPEEAPK